jgi:potassium channel subfamily K
MDQWKTQKGMADWLHGKNPLNATETLTEWLLVTLVDKLEAELRELRWRMGAVTEGLGKQGGVDGIDG